MAKPHITRTLGPIHFEDLDPHRFEDLVRQLAYDFRQWQSIEATGRGGADDGFDIRAYEVLPPSITSEDEDTREETPLPMDGNLWMIQCKREKSLGPKRVEMIVRESVNEAGPPYGFILVAPAHFSKTAHDKFREELRARGVMEFYLWGAGELEDMLHQPKNDHILFAFFGISLTSRRRSRTNEIRSAVNIKNKLRRVLGENPSFKSVFLRDLQDEHYPYENLCKDFERRPRWKEYTVEGFHPLGLIVSIARYYAYFDQVRAEWDFTKAVNEIRPPQNHFRPPGVEQEERRCAVKNFWEQLQRENRTYFVQDGLIRFDKIAFIDDQGDTEYKCPHLFVDFHSERGPVSGRFLYLEKNQYSSITIEGLNRVEIFPKQFSKPTFGTIYRDKVISTNDGTRSALKYGRDDITLYDAEDLYGFLKPTDVIAVDKTEGKEGKKTLLKITNVRIAKGKELLNSFKADPSLKQQVENQLSREVKSNDRVRIIEARVLYDWQIEQNRPVV